jgi:hypothetical protein
LDIGELGVRHAGGIADIAVRRCQKRMYLLSIGGAALSNRLERWRRGSQNRFNRMPALTVTISPIHKGAPAGTAGQQYWTYWSYSNREIDLHQRQYGSFAVVKNAYR